MGKYFLSILFIGILNFSTKAQQRVLPVFEADDSLIQYVGRIDLSDKQKPRMWAAGAYIVVRFKGDKCELLINDEQRYGINHNYLEIAVDKNKPYRIQLKEKENVITVADGLSGGEHTVLICKNTESDIGYIQRQTLSASIAPWLTGG